MRNRAMAMASCLMWSASALADGPQATDVSSIDAIIQASYDALSGPVGAPRQWARYLNLLDPDARLVSESLDAHTGMPTVTRLGRNEYVRVANDYLVRSGFIDRKLGCITNRFDSVASVRCGFEGFEASRLVERGVAFYHVYHDGKSWWILSVEWEQERPGQPIPAELLLKR